MQSDFITIDDIKNMGRARREEQARREERRAGERVERRERRTMEQMRQMQISMLEEQLQKHEEVKQQQRELKEEKKQAKQQYKFMVANDPYFALEEMLYKHTDSIHELPKRPIQMRSTSARGVVDEVVDGMLEDVETLEALDYYDSMVP